MQLPLSFLNSLQQIKGFKRETFEQVHQSGEQITSIRCNPLKHSIQSPTAKKIPWSKDGYYLDERPSFTLDPIFHAGAYYVQEASSMFVEEVLKQTVDMQQPLKVLDLCAAPGGKSTLIQSIISAESLLVSNEVIKPRVNILLENITKWGADNIVVTNNDPKDFKRLPNYFDVIVVDAPCSGSGLFRKDPQAIKEWSENNVQLCNLRQQRILSDAMPALKENGIIIYSTCSYSQEEDEDIADWLVDKFEMQSLSVKIEEDWGIVETQSIKNKAYGYRFYPDKLKGEGFFIAAFSKKKVEDFGEVSARLKTTSVRLTAKEIDTIKPYVKNTENFFFIKQKEEAIAMPLFLENDLAILQSACYIKKAGVKLGTIIRNELIPDHELALSIIINSALPSIEIDLTMALQYLRRQDISINSTMKGWALLTHCHLPLGWIKILPNRINNYYPKDWRILNK